MLMMAKAFHGGLDSDVVKWRAAAIAGGGTVSGARARLLNDLVRGLKGDGIWAKLDRLWLFAAENESSALCDLVARISATKTGSPTFTTDRGYVGSDANPTSVYIDTLYNPTTNAVQYTQNSAHISTWSETNTASVSGGALMGLMDSGGVSGSNVYDTYADGNIYARINESPQSGQQGAPSTRKGHWIVNRSASNATQVYDNGASYSTPNTSSAALINGNFAVLGATLAGNNIAHGTPNQVTMASIGGSLTSTEASNLYKRLLTYMTAVGA